MVCKIIGVFSLAGMLALSADLSSELRCAALLQHVMVFKTTAKFMTQGNMLVLALASVSARNRLEVELHPEKGPAGSIPRLKSDKLDLIERWNGVEPIGQLQIIRSSEKLVFVGVAYEEKRLPLPLSEEQAANERLKNIKLSEIKNRDLFELEFVRGSWTEMFQGAEVELRATADALKKFDRVCSISNSFANYPAAFLMAGVRLYPGAEVREESVRAITLKGTKSEMTFEIDHGLLRVTGVGTLLKPPKKGE